MDEHQALVFAALLILVYGLFSHLFERWSISGPMVFMIVGILASPIGFDLFTVHVNAEVMTLVAEVTLMLILFVDASLIKMDVLRHAPSRIPARLLLIGLPLTMAFGIALGIVLFDSLSLWAIALVALILSPTDAALGQAVVKSEHVPERIRQSISVESGLNDGIALPPILVCMAALGAEASAHEGAWLGFTAKQLIFGPIVGGLVGWLGGALIERVSKHGWMEPTFQRLSCLSLALLAFTCAELIHGNGFIAAFCAGLTLGTISPDVRERIQEFGEAEGVLLSLFVFMFLGLVMVPVAISIWNWEILIYAIASLTVIRMIPVALSLIGAKLDLATVAFIAWFGPRGIASVLYLLMVVAAIGVPGHEKLLSIVVLTVAISVVAHGLTAAPLSRLFGARRG